ncbi:YhdP family protein [Burkholderia singularis]|uniref:YhdP family protein n=1 Tax=Burkholderia singularis TaxID=1503053 RepID=UPI000B773784|nr:YhdP family protein [Burkholderia singularis]
MSDRQDSASTPVAGPPQHDHPVLRRVFKGVLAIAIAVYFIAAALFLGLRYLLLPRIDEFRPRIESFVSEKLHAELRIGRLAPHWSGMQPGVDITSLTIRDRHGKLALSVPHASAALSWRSLAQLAPTLSSLVVDAPDLLAERSADGTLFIAGVAVPTTTKTHADDTFSAWLLKQEAIVLRGGTLRWRDAQHDAPELALNGIRIAVLNDGLIHRLALQAPANGTLLRGPLDFRARFTHKPLAPVGKPSNWTGDAYLSTGPVDLPTLSRYADIRLTAYAGLIDNKIWARFGNGHLQTASGELHGYDVALRVRPTQPRLDIPIARFGWDLAIDPKRDYTLHLSRLHAELSQPALPDGTPLSRALSLHTLSARYRVPNVDEGQLLSVSGDRVDFGILSEFVRGLPLPARLRNELVRFDPRGLVANYALEVERAKPETAALVDQERQSGTAPIIRYRFQGDLQGISIEAQEPPPGLSAHGHPRVGIPGVENLWGHVDANEQGGSVSVDCVDAAVTVPGVFDDPRLTFDRLRGRASWTVTPAAAGGQHAQVDVAVPELRVENADAAISVAGRYANPGHGRGSLDLTANFERAAIAHIARYLPTSLSENLRQYLGHALQAGQINKGATIVAKGPLDEFPYEHDPNAGVFHIVAPFSGGRFEPTPQPPRVLQNGTPNVWPAFDGIDGRFELKQNKLRVDIARARYKGFALTGATGRIDDLGNPARSPLVIEGRGRGPLADLLDYANHSALAGITGHLGERVRAQGPATLALKLDIPQHVSHPHVGVEGTLGFDGNTLEADGVPSLSQLRGNVRFTQRTASVDGLTARFAGGELRARGSLAENGRYAFDIDGRASVDTARGMNLNLRGAAAAALERVVGEAPYRLAVRGAKGGLPEIDARSDLTGIALNFPAPLAKPAGTPMPLHFTFAPEPQPGGQTLERASFTLGPIAAAYLLDVKPGSAIRAVRGTLGMNRMPDMPQEGVSAALDMRELDADAWLAFAQSLRAPAAAPEPAMQARPPAIDLASFAPKRFAFHLDTLKLLKRNWENVIVGASHVDELWQANIASNQVSGYLSWAPGGGPTGAGVLSARLAKLVIPDSAEHDLVGRAIDLPTPANRAMPAIDVIVDQVVAHGHDIGRLEVDARNVDENGIPVWQLDKLELKNPAAKLTATANWRTSRRSLARGVDEDDAPRRTVFDFTLAIDDAGELLERVGLPRTVKNGRGTLSGKVGWRGGPTSIDYPTLGGHLSLDLEHGQILKVDPGAAKLLGVLSLQGLARFLTLDFRDVIGKGLPFEKITGTGQIANGIARTQDFQMTAAPAKVTVKGSVDLANETQQLDAHVAPKISASAAAIGAAIVNPLLGLGVLAANLALSETLAHAFAIDYAITGSWAHPHIERTRGERVKMDDTPEARR